MSDHIRPLQAALSARGYYRGRVDGLWGPMTQAAVIDAARAGDLVLREGGQVSSDPLHLGPPVAAPAHEWDSRSAGNLKGVHPDLVRVVTLARSRSVVPFVVIEGLRSAERQRQLVRSGASQTMNSRHLTGHAIDVAAQVGGKISWDWPLYDRIAVAMKQAADDLGIPIVWGGDWRSFKDGPHYELNRATYPA